MSKLRTLPVVLVAAVVIGGWLLSQGFTIEGLEGVKVSPRDRAAGEDGYGSPPVKRTGSAIRIASFNIQVFGRSKADKPQVMELLARIAQRFDILAIQEIRAQDQDILPQFVEQINAGGRRYDYVIGPRLGRTSSKEQYAFVYDAESIEIDRGQLYTIADPDDILHREPLVGWFRVRGPAPEEAFTFSLVNIHTDPDEVEMELNALDDVFTAVRDDDRQEDDVILLGDLNADDQHLGELGRISGLTWVISGIPTNTRRSAQYDNILFQSLATGEFTGRGGVFDFMREFNLTLDAALEVSDHLPVWAEFSLYEGGQPGRVAAQPRPLRR